MSEIELPFTDQEEWRWRWMQVHGSEDDTLHRLRSFVTKDDDYGAGVTEAIAVCGLTSARMLMPGVFSRGGFASGVSGIKAEGAPRCEECCRLLNIPSGNGCPFNFRKEIGEEPTKIDT
jgi:hypothetical protein